MKNDKFKLYLNDIDIDLFLKYSEQSKFNSALGCEISYINLYKDNQFGYFTYGILDENYLSLNATGENAEKYDRLKNNLTTEPLLTAPIFTFSPKTYIINLSDNKYLLPKDTDSIRSLFSDGNYLGASSTYIQRIKQSGFDKTIKRVDVKDMPTQICYKIPIYSVDDTSILSETLTLTIDGVTETLSKDDFINRYYEIGEPLQVSLTDFKSIIVNESLIEFIKNKSYITDSDFENTFLEQSSEDSKYFIFIRDYQGDYTEKGYIIERYNEYKVLTEIYIVFSIAEAKIPEFNSRNEIVFIDKLGRKSSGLTNGKFFTHQNMMRQIINGVTKDLSWLRDDTYDIGKLYYRSDGDYLTAKYNATTSVYYSIKPLSTNSDIVLEDNNLPQSILSNNSLENTTLKSTECMSDIILKLDKDSLKQFDVFIDRGFIDSSTGLLLSEEKQNIVANKYIIPFIPAATEDDEGKLCVINFRTRNAALNVGDDKRLFNINELYETVNVDLNIGDSASFSSNTSKAGCFSVFDIESENPYLLLPIITTQEDNVIKYPSNSYFATFLTNKVIYTNSSKIGEIVADSNSVDSVVVRWGNGETDRVYASGELGISKEAFFMGMETAILNSNVDDITEATDTINSFGNVYFIKVPIKITTSNLFSTICTLGGTVEVEEEASEMVFISQDKEAESVSEPTNTISRFEKIYTDNSKSSSNPTSTKFEEGRAVIKADITESPVLTIERSSNNTVITTGDFPVLGSVGGKKGALAPNVSRSSIMSMRAMQKDETEIIASGSINYKIKYHTIEDDVVIKSTIENNSTILKRYLKNNYNNGTYIEETNSTVYSYEESIDAYTKISADGQTLTATYPRFIYLDSQTYNLNTEFIFSKLFPSIISPSAGRGEVIKDNVFLERRRSAFKNSLVKMLNSDSIEQVDIGDEIFTSDGTDRAYNYAKSVISIVESSERPLINKIVHSTKKFLDMDTIDASIIFQKKTISTVSKENTINIPEKKTNYVSKERDIFSRLSTRYQYPTEDSYRKQDIEFNNLMDSILTKDDENVTTTRFNNMHLYKEQKKTVISEKKALTTNLERTLLANAIEMALEMDSIGTLDIGLSSWESFKEYDRSYTANPDTTYKTKYNLDIMLDVNAGSDEERYNAINTNFKNLIKKAIVYENNIDSDNKVTTTIMEVYK